jgi:hypothetical protein
MGAEVEVVGFVVDELEGEHERVPWRIVLPRTRYEKQVPLPLGGIGMTMVVYPLKKSRLITNSDLATIPPLRPANGAGLRSG